MNADSEDTSAVEAPFGLKRCMNCGEYRASVDGGWCGPCDGIVEPWDPEVCRRALAKAQSWPKSVAMLAEEAWAERELARGAEIRRAWNAKRFDR